MVEQSRQCPCGSALTLENCCGPFIAGVALPETAQALMRSRYSAYVLRKIDYLKDTLWPSYQPSFDAFAVAKWASESHWTGLTILETSKGKSRHKEGTVLFEARYLSAGTLHTHRELSLFKKQKGRWYYVKALEEA